MPKINRGGVDIYYEVHGSGPPLLLTHGYSSTSGMWQGQIEALSEHYELVLWDMRGHGQSDYPSDPAAYSEALTVADMAALLDEVGAAKAIVGGLSLGGYMSLAFYRSYPDRVWALLIIDTGPGFKKDDAREAWNKRAQDTGDRLERDGLDVLKSGSRERSTVTHRDASGLARAARGMLTQRDARVIESLPDIKVPSLVVVGADDTPFLAASDYMAAKIPGARKIVIPAAGHAVTSTSRRPLSTRCCRSLTASTPTRPRRRHENACHCSLDDRGRFSAGPCAAFAADRRPHPAPFHRDAVEQYAAGFRHGRASSRARAWYPAQLCQRPSGQRGLPHVPQSRRQRIVLQQAPALSAVPQRPAGRLEGRLGSQLDVAIVACAKRH
jgi:pimeloyl-ACP methyl ester carboxylesterase